MKPSELLELLDAKEETTREELQEKYNNLVSNEEELKKKMKAYSPDQPKIKATTKTRLKRFKIELAEAWEELKKLNEKKFSSGSALTHLTKELPKDPANRKQPAEKPAAKTKADTTAASPGKNKQISPKIDAKLLHNLAIVALSKYVQYHQRSFQEECTRGQGPGFFSSFRHGQKGINKAKNFVNSLTTNEYGLEETLYSLRKFLNRSDTAYHHHSFASYLADELASKNLIKPHLFKHYNQHSVVKELNDWGRENLAQTELKLMK